MNLDEKRLIGDPGQVNLELPEWADKGLMQAGSVFFSRHSVNIMSLLGLMSLPYCYTAANGARVLYLSERIRKQTTNRLYDTAIFVWEMMAPDAFQPGGKGVAEIQKIRAMHELVRQHIVNSGKWDMAWGWPINQEDMAGTNLSFSSIVIRGLRLMGIKVDRVEEQSFLHLWNVIGYLMGLQEDLIKQDPRLLDRLISQRQFKTSEHGHELTRSLVAHIMSVNKTKATENDIVGLMRYLLGKEVADQLGLNAPELPSYKILILRTINRVKTWWPQGDPIERYNLAYQLFQTQKP